MNRRHEDFLMLNNEDFLAYRETIKGRLAFSKERTQNLQRRLENLKGGSLDLGSYRSINEIIWENARNDGLIEAYTEILTDLSNIERNQGH